MWRRNSLLEIMSKEPPTTSLFLARPPGQGQDHALFHPSSQIYPPGLQLREVSLPKMEGQPSAELGCLIPSPYTLDRPDPTPDLLSEDSPQSLLPKEGCGI